MDKAKQHAALFSLSLVKNSHISLQTQLLRQLRELILSGVLSPGSKIPSSRVLAAELSVSRVTVAAVVDQLVSEGYLEGRARSGVYVEADLPETLPDQVTPDPVPPQAAAAAQQSPNEPTHLRPFDIAGPGLKDFPFQKWSKHHDQVWKRPEPRLLGHTDPFGWWPLRQAISDHLAQWRGLSCAPSQVIVTASLPDAFGWISTALWRSGDSVVIENPGYATMATALRRHHMNVVPVDVDHNGLKTQVAKTKVPDAKSIVVTPSRHYPLGVTLPLSRRLELIEWMSQTNGYVIEDDFDSEYRFHGQPLPAMMSLSKDSRVIYVGSFSKVAFSALRLGFVVVPQSLVPRFEEVSHTYSHEVGLLSQPVLAEFIRSGDFAIHIRKMRRQYGKRRQTLVTAIKELAWDVLRTEDIPSGMHIVADLAPDLAARLTDQEAADRARAAGLAVKPLSAFNMSDKAISRSALILGFAAMDEEAIPDAVERLAQVLRQ